MILKIIGSGSAGNHMAYALQKLADKTIVPFAPFTPFDPTVSTDKKGCHSDHIF